MDVRPNAAIFDELLRLNPWAEPHWHERNGLVRSGRWNINSPNQGGNAVTRDWLSGFLSARSLATLQRLRMSPEAHTEWTAGIYGLIEPLFQDDAFLAAHPGPPMRQVAAGRLVNFSETVEGYSIGQLKADVLLLTQPSLGGLAIDDPLDVSGKAFLIGLDAPGARFHGPLNAQNTRFGPYTEFSEATINDADFSGAVFFDGVSFVMTRFGRVARFSKARFLGPAGFDAAHFQGLADLSDVEFDDSVQLNGARFDATPVFSRATFKGDASFGDATFNASADFADSRFLGPVHTGGIPADIRQMIVDARQDVRGAGY